MAREAEVKGAMDAMIRLRKNLPTRVDVTCGRTRLQRHRPDLEQACRKKGVETTTVRGLKYTSICTQCRNYFSEFGYCNRGPSCPYSHGEDALIAGGGPNGMPFVPPMPPAMAMQMLNGLFQPGWQPGFLGPPGLYDPRHAHFGPPAQVPFPNGPYDSGIQDLTPRNPRDSPRRAENGPYNSVPVHGEDVLGMDDTPINPTDSGVGQIDRNNFRNMGPSARGGRGFGGRGGRGARPERTHRSNVVDPDAVTLVVEKLPPDKTNIGDLSTYFGKFGTVTNVGVDPRGNRALVSFSNHQEAYAAWKSEEAVFGNRFVVIFWHRPAPGGGIAGQKALEASAETLRKLNSIVNGESDVEMAAGDVQAKSTKPQVNGHALSDPIDQDSVMDTATPKKSDPKTPQEIFEYATRVWLEKMKGVMDVMQSTTVTEAEKQEAKMKFKVLKSQKPQPPATPAAGTSELKPNGLSGTADIKEKLDLDLDMLASGQGQPLTQEEAQRALAQLQELAAERGLDPEGLEIGGPASAQAPGVYRGSWRGRGWRGGYRGRGRGRGSMALANASLDNRTKTILLGGYENSGISDDTALDMVQSFYLVSRLCNRSNFH